MTKRAATVLSLLLSLPPTEDEPPFADTTFGLVPGNLTERQLDLRLKYKDVAREAWRWMFKTEE